MKLIILIVIVGFVCVIALAIVVALYHHKKQAKTGRQFVGENCQVYTILDPEGTVTVGGELWCARSVDARVIKPSRWVRIVGIRNHLLLVEELNELSGPSQAGF